MTGPIDVAFCFDDHHRLAAAAAMLSLLASRTEPVRVNVLIDPGSRAPPLLRAIAAYHGVDLRIVEAAGEQAHGFDGTSDYGRASTATYRRIFLPDLLPDLDRVIYLDADVMVRASLRPLWETDLGGGPLAAAPDPWMSTLESVRAAFPRGYFNAGVMLFDLDRWREERLTGRCVAEINRRQGLAQAAGGGAHAYRHEQTPLNTVLDARWTPLSLGWNCAPLLDDLLARDLSMPREMLMEAVGAPAIVHFLGSHKPWLDAFAAVTRWHVEYQRWRGELERRFDCGGAPWPAAFGNDPQAAWRRRIIAMRLVQRARTLGFRAPVVVLTGLLAGEIAAVAREQDLSIAAFAGVGPAYGGGRLDGLEVLSIGEALRRGHTDVILGDYRRPQRTRAMVETAAHALGLRPRILGVDA